MFRKSETPLNKKSYNKSSFFIEAKTPVFTGKEFAHEGITYYLHSDKHGEPKHLNKKLAQCLEKSGSRSSKEYKNSVATFNHEARNNYSQLLNLAIKTFILNKGCSYFIDLGQFVGWDNGIKTSVVELYYGDEIGSHIRPKAIFDGKKTILTVTEHYSKTPGMIKR